METLTSVGKDLDNLGYKEDLVRQVDGLFFRLYCIPLSERNEIAGVMKKYIDNWVR